MVGCFLNGWGWVWTGGVVGGFHRTSRNIAIRQNNVLKGWPYTSKFTIDHPEQIKIDFRSIRGFSKLWGPWNALDHKIQICPISIFLSFGKI